MGEPVPIQQNVFPGEGRDRREAPVVVLGEELAVTAYGLAGAVVVAAEDEAQVWAGWADAQDAAIVVLTARASAWLGEARVARGAPPSVVLP